MFYKRFIELCRARGISPSAAVNAIGLNKSNATYWKNGSVPKAQTLYKLAEYFDVPIDYFININEYGADVINAATIYNVKKIGENIRNAREEAGLTQEELAQKVNIDTAIIYQYEAGTINPDINQMYDIARAMNTTLETILHNVGGTFRMSIESSLIGSLDWYAKKHNHSLDMELSIAVDQYLDALIHYDPWDNHEEIDSQKDEHDEQLSKKILGLLGQQEFYNTFFTCIAMLTDEGQKKALERIEELAEIPRYRREEYQDQK